VALCLLPRNQEDGGNQHDCLENGMLADIKWGGASGSEQLYHWLIGPFKTSHSSPYKPLLDLDVDIDCVSAILANLFLSFGKVIAEVLVCFFIFGTGKKPFKSTFIVTIVEKDWLRFS
jgi:hypothetical protein